jgi:hypothetical protein
VSPVWPETLLSSVTASGLAWSVGERGARAPHSMPRRGSVREGLPQRGKSGMMIPRSEIPCGRPFGVAQGRLRTQAPCGIDGHSALRVVGTGTARHLLRSLRWPKQRSSPPKVCPGRLNLRRMEYHGWNRKARIGWVLIRVFRFDRWYRGPPEPVRASSECLV